MNEQMNELINERKKYEGTNERMNEGNKGNKGMKEIKEWMNT